MTCDSLNKSYNSSILFNRALANLKLDNTAEALKDLDLAIECNANYTKAYIKKGDILMQKEKYEEACREYNQAKEIEPHFAGIG